MKEINMKVKGMVCGGCENRVKNALSDVNGVKSVEASFETGVVKVIADESVSSEIIENTVNDIGFEVTSVN